MRNLLLLRLPRSKFCFFCATAATLIFLSALTVLSGKRDVESLFFRRGEDFFADTFNLYVFLDSKNIYTGDGAETEGHYGHGISRYFRNNPPMVFCHFDLLRKLSRAQNTPLFLAVYVSVLLSLLWFFLLYRNVRGSESQKLLFCGCILFSSVFIHALERGNIILLAALYVTFYLFAWNSENPVQRELALLALAMAAALKVYPAVLGLLPAFSRQWMRCGRLLIYGALFSFLPFLWFPGGFGLIPDLMFNVFSPQSVELPVCVLFDAWTPLLLKLRPDTAPETLRHALHLAGVLFSAAACAAAYFDRKRWRQTSLLVLSLLLAPKIGAGYNYLYAVPCLVLFLNDPDQPREELWMAVLFAVILSPLLFPLQWFRSDLLFLKSLSLDLFVLLLLGASVRDSFRRHAAARRASPSSAGV